MTRHNEPAPHWHPFDTAIGGCGIAWRNDTIVATTLPERSLKVTVARLERITGGREGEPPPAIRQVVESIVALLNGERVDLNDAPCDFSKVTTFDARVYEVARAVPPGETSTYGNIARELGDPQLAQSVGGALGRNPFPIIVPCHRIIGANGKLTGFSAHGGVKTKLEMLMIEGARFGDQPGLFDDLPMTSR